MLDTKYQLPPKLVCVFSFSNPKSLEYITRFEKIRKQLECRGTALEFRLMNIGEKNNSQGRYKDKAGESNGKEGESRGKEGESNDKLSDNIGTVFNK